MTKLKIFVLNGPNLNMLGLREPDTYGIESLQDIENYLVDKFNFVDLSFYQTNSESKFIEYIHRLYNDHDYIVINPAAWTHTSIAIRDALLSINAKFVEVHLSNIYGREEFRHKSFFSDKALGVITGLGSYGYEAAINFIVNNHK